MKLTTKEVAKVIRRGDPREVSDTGSAGGVRGLRLIVSSKKAASWELRYQRHGNERYMGLGSARGSTIADHDKQT
jgi:hypothetical protein